ncbi:LysE family translocator [Glycomyces luteolus]|uniref:LysE family translocator n=1 Tax=Glycomyces luteolus TaxID=2670330 RepID=A0A9X3PN41_9ACTN|nr:LysE family translocator [Glycomyces luteolus]MDA1361865.1 LysE family translocator [Glycomyces luteolus]
MMQLLVYGGVFILGAASPGPDFLIVTKHAMTGRRPGLAAAAGIAGGVGVHAAVALAGLGAVLLASPGLYAAVRLIAAGYLVYLGATALWAIRPRRPGDTAEASEPSEDEAPLTGAGQATTVRTKSWTAFRQGLLTNVLNAKVVAFLITLMPGFLPTRPDLLDMTAIWVVSVAVTLVWFGLLALAVAHFSAFLQRPRVNFALTLIVGCALLAIGGYMAVSTLAGL